MTRIKQIDRIYEVIDTHTGKVLTRTNSQLAAQTYSDEVNRKRRQKAAVPSGNVPRRNDAMKGGI